ncbi:MAG: hypothetical protein V1866_06820 [archaeon]
MGEILANYFQRAAARGGLNAQVKFAMLTKMSGKKAREAPDSPENIKMFDEAIAKL